MFEEASPIPGCIQNNIQVLYIHRNGINNTDIRVLTNKLRYGHNVRVLTNKLRIFNTKDCCLGEDVGTASVNGAVKPFLLFFFIIFTDCLGEDVGTASVNGAVKPFLLFFFIIFTDILTV